MEVPAPDEAAAWESWRRAQRDGHTSELGPVANGPTEHEQELRYLRERVYPAVLRACRRHRRYNGGASAAALLDDDADADDGGKDTTAGAEASVVHDCYRERCRMHTLRVLVYDTDSGLAHVCVHGVCSTRRSEPARHRADATLFDLRHVYVCTGHPAQLHVCDDRCEYASVRHDRDRAAPVCPLTGRVHAARNLVFERVPGRGPLRDETGGGHADGTAGGFPGALSRSELPAAGGGHTPAVSASLHGEEQYQLAWRALHLAPNEADEEVRRLIAACTDAHLAAEPAAKRRRSASAARVRAARDQHASWRDTYLSVAVVQMALLLDLRRLRDRVAEDEQRFRQVGVQLERYVTSCAHTRVRPCLLDMHAVTVGEQTQWPQSPYVYVDDACMVQMVLSYARRAVSLWFVLVTDTEFGTAYTAAQRFHQFVECAVHLFRDGYRVSASVAARVRQAHAQDAEAFATVDALFAAAGAGAGHTATLGWRSRDAAATTPMQIIPPDAFLRVAAPEERVGLDPTEASGGGTSRGTRLEHGPRRRSLTPGFHGQRLVPLYSKAMQCVRDTLDHYAVHVAARVDVPAALRQHRLWRTRVALDGTRNTSRDVGIGRAAVSRSQTSAVTSSAQSDTLRSSLTHGAAAARMFGTGSVPTLLGHAPVRASSRRAQPLNSTRARATYGVSGVTSVAARVPLVAPRRGYLSKLQQAMRQALDAALTRTHDPLPVERVHTELPDFETLPHQHALAFAPLRQ